MDQVCQLLKNQTRNHQNIEGNIESLSYRRINSPGLPNSSLRSSCKGDKKRLEIGLITDRKLSESPNLDRMFSTENFKKIQQQKNSIIEIPQPQSQIPKMEPPVKRNLRMIEKLESDKLCLKIYISEEDQNQLIFTGISKEKLQSPKQNKNALIKNLQQLFQKGIKDQNKYMKLESLEKHVNLENQQYYGLQKKNNSNSSKNIITQNNESKSNLDRSLSISTIQEYKSNQSSKINKDLDILESGLNKQRNYQQSQSNSKFQKSQPLGTYNLTINLKQKQKDCKITSQNKKGPSPSFSQQQRNSQQKCVNKMKSNAKSLHV